MAQGLIRSSDEGQKLEDIGNRYINELWSRSFFQDISVSGPVIWFKMHDLVHDLVLLITKDEFLSMSARTQSIPKMIRYVTFHDVDLSCQNVPNILLNQNQLRTIIFPYVDVSVTSNSFVETCTSRFKYVRTLDLSDSSVEVLSSSIGNFKHLRLFNLSNNKSIKKLPKSICKLQNLPTLYLHGCSELEKLPKDIGKYLISLRVLSVTTKQTSLEIGCLPTSLRSLGIYDCENLKSLGEGMQRLTTLRSLGIYNCKSVERLPRGLNCSTTLETLVLKELPEIDTMEFEEDEGDLPPSLRYLVISEIPKIKALPRWLQGSADSLERLLIGDCYELSTLPSWLQDFTSLRTLDIRSCPQLSALPEGMNHLTELVIDDCAELTNRCQPEIGEDWPNIAHVPTIILDEEIIKSPEN